MKKFTGILILFLGVDLAFSPIMAAKDDGIPKRLDPLMSEINGVRLEAFKAKEIPLNQALDLAFSLAKPKCKYIVGYTLSPLIPKREINLNVNDISFGSLLLLIADQALVRVDEKNGILIFEDIKIMGDEIIVVPLKKAVVDKFGFNENTPARDVLDKLKIITLACEFFPERNTLAVKAVHNEAETLRSLLLLFERGYSVSSPP